MVLTTYSTVLHNLHTTVLTVLRADSTISGFKALVLDGKAMDVSNKYAALILVKTPSSDEVSYVCGGKKQVNGSVNIEVRCKTESVARQLMDACRASLASALASFNAAKLRDKNITSTSVFPVDIPNPSNTGFDSFNAGLIQCEFNFYE